MALDEMLKYLEVLANDSLRLWDVPEGARARLINVAENAIYRVEAEGYRAVLRVHRENYHSQRAIECELAWSSALNAQSSIATPGVYLGRNGKAVQCSVVDGLPEQRFMVLFHFVEGVTPDLRQDLAAPFEELGEIAARTHLHSIDWARPEPFERLTWDLDAVFGATPTWGRWRDAPNVTPAIETLLTRVEDAVKHRLTAFGRGPERYGLIHADMRLANLLIGRNGTRLIDFDDCGMGWHLYDFAAAISFMEDHPQVPALKAAWLKGYRKARDLPDEDAAEIDTFVMLRRLALLAWVGSRIEAPEPQALAPEFARLSAELGEAYLSKFE